MVQAGVAVGGEGQVHRNLGGGAGQGLLDAGKKGWEISIEKSIIELKLNMIEYD
jgi:hypothetical protein